MKNATRYNAQLGTATVVVVFVHVAHMWRVIQPETEDQAVYDDLFEAILAWFLGDDIIECVARKSFYYNFRHSRRTLPKRLPPTFFIPEITLHEYRTFPPTA